MPPWLFAFAAQGQDVYNNDGGTGTVTFDACGVSKAMSDCCTLPPPTCWSCDSSTGKCAPNRAGSQAPGDCYSKCKCITPHNCGQLNGTVACRQYLAGCNVCDACCFTNFNISQGGCDSCFNTAAPIGCGGKL